jgi:protocatechuate 3,4-dioxygenase beta subunit
MSMEGRGGGVTSTDAEGRYEIKELPAGRYNVTASKGGFVQGSFGQRRPGEPGTPIDLSDGQSADKVNFVLARGGVISGRIVDDGGEPVSGTMVAAMRVPVHGWIAAPRARRRRRQHRIAPTIRARSGSSACPPVTTTSARTIATT